MCGSECQGEPDGIVPETTFFSEVSLLSEGVCTAQAEGGPTFRHLGAGEKLSQRAINKHFAPIDPWGQNNSAHL